MRHVMHNKDGVVSQTQCTYALDCCSQFETHSYLQTKKNIYFSINLQAPCVLCIGQAFHYSAENAFYIFNQQMYKYFII